ncbi:transcription-repair coupling factor [Desulfoprunum benzoelyticum]|uniref:transcription-repair coupling factor n=1 Tax=Desulfoprunum benzoelyticum TaxID=1506996 RepID=UPI0030B8537F
MKCTGLRGSSPALLGALLAEQGPCCCIVPDEQMVAPFEQDLRLFAAGKVLSYPAHEIPPYTPLAPDQQTTALRLSTLYQLTDSNSPPLVVTSIEALMRRVMPKGLLTRIPELILAGEDIDIERLISSLVMMGYEQVALVQSVGDFSLRGGILDIYPPPFPLDDSRLYDGPVRLDFFGDTVESLRAFDPLSQRSTMEIAEAILLPVSDILLNPTDKTAAIRLKRSFQDYSGSAGWEQEPAAALIEQAVSGRRFAGMQFYLPLFYPAEPSGSSAVLDFFPRETTLLLVSPEAINQNMDLVEERIVSNFAAAQAAGRPALHPDRLFLDAAATRERMAGFHQALCSDFNVNATATISLTTQSHLPLKQDIHLQRRDRGILTPLSEQINSWQREGDRIILCCRSSRHMKNLRDLLARHHHLTAEAAPPLDLDQFAGTEAERTVFLCNHPLTQGFSLTDLKIHLLSESELFGEMRLGKRRKGNQEGAPLRFAELNDGDIIVHRDHGLGVYQGLVTMRFNDVTNDFVQIEYRDGDRLYVPVDRLNLISRYEGLSDQTPKIDKLGTQTWKTTTAKVKEEVWKVAQELLEIYATRELREGRQFSPPAELFHELEESFPFDETPGQDKAITEVIDDLISDKPMDRLVCGDVGYGKTEVAVRAAFKVVEDGMQVAILVPTTVLAEQHAKTFRERLQGFPVRVECINRFRTTSEQKKLVKALAEGGIDILIGTHRLLSKDIVFKSLGLLIVDEEHRFGVAHKEKVKKLRAAVDVLTLTATPIPRTLQMSLLGIRDLSVISSPPEHRRPVKTFVAQYDDLVIKEAVTREIRRNGQVFFVHNRVRSIHQVATNIKKLVPTARIAVAHGQMAGKELEDIMVAFVNHDIDVLICTTIIESGLDIPSANTIIINRADQLGLAEIYQLRGRVGRSSLQSYAFLLVPSLDSLTKDSRDRLQALMDCDELGGGFRLAMSDLQIRGGGNLLGVSQSGHIAAIGYDLYLDLLQKTVADLKASAGQDLQARAVDDIDPEINLHISAFIPQQYMPDISQRYMTYRRIAALTSAPAASHDELQEELIDRYGPLPQELRNLFRIVSLKADLAALRINKLERGNDSLVYSFMADTPLQPERLLSYLQRQPKKRRVQAKLTPDGRLVVTGQPVAGDDLFETIGSTVIELRRMSDDPD